MVISDCSIHRFSSMNFENNSWELTRGFATIEVKATAEDTLPCARIIGTHLIHNNREKRKEQVEQIVEALKTQKPSMATFLLGDLNIERDSKEAQDILTPHLVHGFTKDKPTATNDLVNQWSKQKESVPGLKIDYASMFKQANNLPVKEATIQSCKRVKAFDESYNTRSALSDHHGLSAKFSNLL